MFQERWWRSSDGLHHFARDYAAAEGEAKLPVICLHGLTRNSADFDEVAPRIAATGRRVLALDVRGRGRSDRDRNAANYHPKVYARDVLALMDALGIGRAGFVGTSMGGLITLTIALLRRSAIGAVILNDVGPAIDLTGIRRIQSYVGKAPVLRSWDEASDYMRSIYGDTLPDMQAGDWEQMARRTFRDGPDGPELDYDPAIAPDPKARVKASSAIAWFAFRRIARRVPAMLIHGAQSDIMPSSIASRMKARAPALRVVAIPGVGHAPRLPEPEAAKAIDEFLSGVP
jgi:pimeloyl-ACP methyl ester carboxylesterase